VCHTVVYLQNKSPHIVLGKLTPTKAFTGTMLDVNDIHIWGNVCYYHLPSVKRTKLDLIAEKGLLVGYSEASKAYRIFVSSRRKIILCRDVHFEEESALWRSNDLPTLTEDQQGHDSGVKVESVWGQVSRSQGTQGIGTGVQIV
jgi:hypothetical protein